MKMTDRESLEQFREETENRLNRISGSLDRLAESRPVDRELLHGIFRDTHSLKGGANLLGLRPVEQLAHKLEDILESIRNGSDLPDRALIDILSAGYGRIAQLLEHLHLLPLLDMTRDLADIDRRLASRQARTQRRSKN